MSGTRTELTIVAIIGPALLVLDDRAGAAGGLDLLAGGLRERVRADRELLADLALAEALHRDALPRRQAARLESRRGHLVAVGETLVEVAQVHGLRVGAEALERHRLLHVRSAQLAHPHVDRHLAALGAGARLCAAPRAGALLAAPRGLPDARSLATANSLLRVPRAGRGLQAVEADLLAHHSSTFTRCRTAWTAPLTP